MEEKTENQYRNNAVDIHSHVIWDVDDGARTMEEALELISLDREEGIAAVFATPHHGKGNVGTLERGKARERFQQLRETEACRNMDLYLGTEWYCDEDIVDQIRRKEAFPMGETDWYMVEFLEYEYRFEPADDILRRLKKLKSSGIKTILAHAERYTAIQDDWDLAKRIRDLGVLLQVNAYDLFLNGNDETRDLAQWMAKEQMISFLGSDMHGTRHGKHPPKMKEGIRWLYEHVDEEYANDVVRRNAEKYLGVEKLLK